MDLGVHPILLAIAALCAALALLRLSHKPSSDTLAAIDNALERAKSGEANVRIEPGRPGRDARLVSRVNEVLTQIENDSYDWAHADPQESAMFNELRRNPSTESQLGESTFVAVAEIDRFAALRQSIGYRLANQLLGVLADRIVATISRAERGRIGRTTIEFAFKARDAGEAQLQLLAAIEALEARVSIDDYSFDLSVAIGFANAGNSSIRDELVDQAAAALHAAQAERVKVCFADERILARNGLADLELMRALPRAIEAGEITLHYQPKLEARTNSITSVEALVRWNRPGIGLVPTDRFIALAEETGAIRDLTEWVIGRAVSDQKTLLGQGHEIDIYVNISGHLLPDREFATVALALVENASGKIGFEITETAVIGDPDAALANLREFTLAGIKIAIDDYGSGLSSLAYLKQLPAHELKIDRLFVSGLTDSHRDPLIIRSSIDLAHALEMVVTAEGVDDAMALSLLRVMGCDLLQGFFISPPIPLDELRAFLADGETIQRIAGPAEAEWPLARGA